MAHDQIEKDAVLQLISEAALQPSLWQQALPAVAHYIGGADVCRITAWDTVEDLSPLQIRTSSSIDDATIDEHERLYFTHYRKLDPRLRVAHSIRGRLGSDHEFLDAGFVARNEFFQDLLRPHGNIRWTAGGRIHERANIYADIALERSADRPAFAPEELTRLNRLRTHLMSAMATHFHLREAGLTLEMTQSALDRLDQGVMVLDKNGALQLANRRAEALLRQATFLKVSAGVLTTADAFQRPALKDALLQLASTQQTVSLTLHSHEDACGTDTCFMTLLPWRNQAGAMPARPWDVSHPFVIVLLSIKHAQRVASARQFMQLFQLTPAEARVARSLSIGRTVDNTADDLALSIHTVRSHVKALLSKTDCANLSVLCSVLARIPSGRA